VRDACRHPEPDERHDVDGGGDVDDDRLGALPGRKVEPVRDRLVRLA
jgi:hypothetical protein